jgi:molybdopterin molybdotransferase
MSNALNVDVRMQGFSDRALAETLWQWLDQQLAPLAGESLPLAAACGRVLAAPIVATSALPNQAQAAMDGYAVNGLETIGASEYNPLFLQLIGLATPAEPFRGVLSPQHAVAVMTGAALPTGADAVLPAEYAEASTTTLTLTQPVAPADNVMRIGADVAAESLVFAAGHRLRPQDLALLSLLAQDTVSVIRAPQVRLLMVGDELCNGHTLEANSPMLRALIARDGGCVVQCECVPDQPDRLAAALTAPGADLILVSGGAGIGANDWLPLVLAEHGELIAHGVAVRPCSGAGLGQVQQVPVLLLPGNPAACFAAYDLFAARAIRRAAGLTPALPYARQQQPLARKIVSAPGRLDYCRVQYTADGLVPLGAGNAGLLSSVTRADGFVLIPLNSEGYPPGTMVEMYCY